jgi:hypothetical protein
MFPTLVQTYGRVQLGGRSGEPLAMAAFALDTKIAMIAHTTTRIYASRNTA